MEGERFYEKPIKPRRPETDYFAEKQREKIIEPIFEEFLFKKEAKFINEFREIELKEDLPKNTFKNLKIPSLEDNRRNRRVDRFILDQIALEEDRRRLRRLLPPQMEPQVRVEPAIQRPEPQIHQLPLPSRKDFISPTGFRASTHLGDLPRTATVKGQRVVLEDGKFTEIHFTPDRRNYFDRARMTDSLTKGIQGIMELLEAVDRGEFESAQLLVGVTNINMALIAQRLGFVIVDECRTPDGEIDRKSPGFGIVGKLEDIRTKVEEFKRAGTVEKLNKRSTRQPASLTPRLAR